MSGVFSLSLYHASFAPLWISILFIDIKGCIENPSNRWTELISIACILISCLISSIVLMAALCTSGKQNSTPSTIVSATEEKTITAEYLLSYILPLSAFDFTQWGQVILFLIFYLTLGFLRIRHNYFSVNIVLEIANFRCYSCTIKNEDGVKLERKILSRQRLNECINEELYLRSINNEYKLDLGIVSK